MKTIITTLISLSLSTGIYAQTLKVPAASSGASITQAIGIHDVTLKYSRPNMNGRKIFGGLVPFGSVWRLGANGIPVITFEDAVSIEGHKIEPGTYGLFAIPEKDKWTIIISKKSNQWGSYSYSEADDLLRFTVKPSTLPYAVETYTMSFDNVSTAAAVLAIEWDHTQVQLHLTVDQKAEIKASIDAAMAGEKKPYMQAAQYYYDNNIDIKKAVEYVNEADKAQPNVFYIKYWKAKILLKSGDKAGAIANSKESLELAKKDKIQEYINLNNELLKQAGK
ncbi:DUF2911 domain-containing protein [Chitinophaga sancti]|uniref:DUF2911 domain-containing protein n=1 Tax=Chitinophaga sancti TaxID=1004 RepID=A0A1K1SVS1_9BACT|nr:DUF2911 domain-containing protein [Chitinophaga sancti]WQD63803.1 DUF2911 domain-containing protein [Chitinophaga sancti]WQG90572.1 DUF2911 domain-containing protein [Chitinophaga sancti]SFW88159.1 Protein of unknown function [Chitinophaga sancti]